MPRKPLCRRWIAEDDAALIAWCARGGSMPALAVRLGRKLDAVVRRIKKLREAGRIASAEKGSDLG